MKNYRYLLNWIGGKRLLRKSISKIIPDNINGYIEPFGGGAWVLFYKDKWADLEVYNDLDNRLINLFNVVKYHPCELARQMCYMLASREQFEQQLKYNGITDIQKAANFLYIITRSFGAKGETFGTSRKCGIKSAGGIIERVLEISKRLDKVIIEHKNAFELIQQYDTIDNFFYCDPPYSQGEGYKVCSTKEFQHDKLVKILKNLKGRFLLSYDDSDYIRDLYKDFNIIEVSRQKGINNKTVKEKKYNELLIKNY
jgi:DNA adenine methylase